MIKLNVKELEYVEKEEKNKQILMKMFGNNADGLLNILETLENVLLQGPAAR